MSKKRGGENIWIAYSDMLTVLLMVFLLLALLFQVIVATSKIVNSSDDNAHNKKSQSSAEVVVSEDNKPLETALGNEKQQSDDSAKMAHRDKQQNRTVDETQSGVKTTQHSENTDKAADANSEKTTGSSGNSSQIAAKLPIVMVDTALLQPHAGDLRINIALSRTYLTNAQKEEVRAWARKYKMNLTTSKLRIFSVGRSVDVSTGDTLLMQVNRAVATMAVLQKEGAIIKNIRFDNLIVPDNKDDFIILRVENADDEHRP